MSAEQLSVAALVRVQDGHSDLGYFLPPPPREREGGGEKEREGGRETEGE